jgi:hypothetical protein
VNRTAARIQETLAEGGAAAEALQWIETDLAALHVTEASVYRPPAAGQDPDPYRFRCYTGPEDPADFKRLEFAARAHRPLAPSALEIAPGALARVSYFVRRIQDGFVLMRTDVFDLQAGPDPPATAAVICENVLSLRWTLVDDQGQAHDEWDSDDDRWRHATPRAVALTIEVGPETAGRVYHARVAPVMVREGQR